jgi:hypothetical protein
MCTSSIIVHYIFNEGLSYVDMNKCYVIVILLKIIRSIAIAFKESGQLVLKLRSGVWYPIIQNEHIQQLMEYFKAHSNTTLESFHH